jgi:UDP-N-acetylmuramate--alanine ligase
MRLMAIAMAKNFGYANRCNCKALTSLRELKEGFHQIKTDKLVYIDDYAHHPTEINAVHQAVRELYPKKKSLGHFSSIYSVNKRFC